MSSFVDSFDDSETTEIDSPAGHFGSTSHNDSGYNPEQFDDEPVPIYGSAGEFVAAEKNGSGGYDGELDGSYGAVLPPPSEMAETGLALREWRRENALRLEEKEKKEKELLSKIIEEAEDYKLEFHKKREVAYESHKAINRETEKLFVAKLDKFHAEADKDYWKSIAELIPNEVPAIEKKRAKDQEKNPSITVVRGPKPGKPTDLSRMRNILVQLKHITPTHLKLTPTAPAKKVPKTSDDSEAAITSNPIAAAEIPKAQEPLAVA